MLKLANASFCNTHFGDVNERRKDDVHNCRQRDSDDPRQNQVSAFLFKPDDKLVTTSWLFGWWIVHRIDRRLQPLLTTHKPMIIRTEAMTLDIDSTIIRRLATSKTAMKSWLSKVLVHEIGFLENLFRKLIFEPFLKASFTRPCHWIFLAILFIMSRICKRE